MNRETGFVPTVVDSRTEGDELILETLDPREETDFFTDPLERVGDTLTEEQQDKLALREKQ